jgi:hypothetical protein
MAMIPWPSRKREDRSQFVRSYTFGLTSFQRAWVSDAVEQIKALRASHRIEAAPRRIGSPSAAGQEPVTASIRRRLAEVISPQDNDSA